MNTFIQYFGLACISLLAILVVHSLFKQAKNFYQGKLSPVDPATLVRQKNWARILGVGLLIVGPLQMVSNLAAGLQVSSHSIGQAFIGVMMIIFSFFTGQGAFTGTNSFKGMKVLIIISFILFIAAYLFVFSFGGLSSLLSN